MEAEVKMVNGAIRIELERNAGVGREKVVCSWLIPSILHWMNGGFACDK